MRPICRILLIEDDRDEAAAIERACCPNPDRVALDVFGNGAEAEDALRNHEYDLIVCDLALPTDGRRLEPETSEGLRLFALTQDVAHGTPVIILSGHATWHMVPGFVQANRQEDLYGLRTPQPMVQFFHKDQLPDCMEAIRTHIARLELLDAVELTVPDELNLSLSDQRALRIYGRRTGATKGEVGALDGGLSDSKTLKVAYADKDAAATGAVVAKLGDIRRVVREAERFEEVAARLPVGVGALVLYVVAAGAGKRGALVYQLADEHARSLFGLLADDAAAASAAVGRLQKRLVEWAVDGPLVARRLIDLRRPLVSDLQLREAGVDIQGERDKEVTVRRAISHGDLHGLNILVNQAGDPTLIDYGEVRYANAALDPVTLELSVLYHPAMVGLFGGWPTDEQAEQWTDLDRFCAGSPVEPFVRACRDWALSVSAGIEEVLATAYCYSIRQVKYGDRGAPIAAQVARGAFAAMRGA